MPYIKDITDEEIENLIKKEHWENKKSIRLIERELGSSNGSLNLRCKKMGLSIRSRISSIKNCQDHITRPSGVDHWTRKKPDLHKRNCELRSKEMKANNPVYIEGVLEKMASSKAETYRKNPTFHESMMLDFFKLNCIPFEFQKQVGTYIVDFRLGDCLLELDGRGHCSRKETDMIRDKSLCSLGWNVVRIDQDLIFNKGLKNPVFRPYKLMQVLKNYIPLLNVPDCPPSIICKHRVIVRESGGASEVVY